MGDDTNLPAPLGDDDPLIPRSTCKTYQQVLDAIGQETDSMGYQELYIACRKVFLMYGASHIELQDLIYGTMLYPPNFTTTEWSEIDQKILNIVRPHNIHHRYVTAHSYRLDFQLLRSHYWGTKFAAYLWSNGMYTIDHASLAFCSMIQMRSTSPWMQLTVESIAGEVADLIVQREYKFKLEEDTISGPPIPTWLGTNDLDCMLQIPMLIKSSIDQSINWVYIPIEMIIDIKPYGDMTENNEDV